MMHVVFTMANNSSVPYFNWFADKAGRQDSPIRMSFVCLFPFEPKMMEDMSRRNCDCHWISFNHERRRLSMILAVFRLMRLFLKIKPDVVHSHLFDDSVPALIACWLLRVPKRVITKADTGFHWFYTPKWVTFDRLNNFLATDIIAISEENKEFIVHNEHAKREKVSMIHHGIPTAKYTTNQKEKVTELKERWNLKGMKVVGNVSRLIDWKGQRHLLRAIANIAHEYKNLRLLLVGVGDDLELLRKMSIDLGISDKVIFAGWLDREEIPAFYQMIDIYVHAASFEPFGFVIAEAYASGTPIVSTKTGLAKDIILEGVTGYLVDHKDANGLSNGIRKVFSGLLNATSQDRAKNP